MKLIFYLVFMTPLVFLPVKNLWWLIQMILIISMLFFSMFHIENYFSSISYFFGLDFYSYGLIMLTILIISLMVISSNNIKLTYYNFFFLFMCLILCLVLVIIFCCLNMFMMYVFFELSLIPLMILIFGWGYQPERLIAGLYLFFYTLVASLPLLVLLIYFYMSNYTLFFDMKYNFVNSFIVHLFLVFAFLVKLPMFMVHFWLPKAHVQAPISGSMILAGLLLKIGGYGILRFMLINELLFLNYSFLWFSLSMMGAILVSLICLVQGDVKCLIAYSSIAHMSLCIMGLMSMSKLGVLGSYFLMISHGLCSSGLFCLANISYERFSSRSFFFNKGMLGFMPSMCIFWFMFCSFNMGCPPSLNFLSEILILNSMMSYWYNCFYYFLFISFFSACFSFYLFSFTQHGSWNFLYSYSLGYIREYLLLIVHLFPLMLLLLSMNSFY
uniref:NADH-ubiquinone oxidoreductase chain 4 n=2 Tax=Empoascanara TaxID=562279 RepID=A0AA51RGZ9_9HEMI|nr:NADH dehydrogenase subunit 4 [Empoascanara falcata]YP_010952900.1 NADH dehydrogenase subunit 4 [Empoascanara quarta]WMQ52343.1 NADH dehydrogenase subunit 4 [Empoascanara quarta]WMQ53073.1 NADH dehydrogenase subunit 4 [Empoascanara falcata]